MTFEQLRRKKKISLMRAIENDLSATRRLYQAVQKESEIDSVGDMMMISARVFATAGQQVPEEYLHRVAAHSKNRGWSDV